jgi:uncharacterized protein YjbI with pentapeptide repeats
MKPKRSLSAVGLCFFLMVGLSWEVGAFSDEDLAKLKTTGSCVQCNLSGANLTGAHLIKAVLPETNLTGAILTEANLTGANLEGATFCYTTIPDGTINNSGC